MPSEAKRRAPDRLDLDHFVPYRLSVLSNRASDAIARHYSERFGLSIPEWRVMAVLGQTPGLSASEVAARTAMDKVQVSRAVANLLLAKRIARAGDAKDGRVTRLSLSRQGSAIYDEIVPLALHLEEVLLGALSAQERRDLESLMRKLTDRVNRLHVSGI
jgi:DNA-binding MarR family transcriptional regulator